MKRTDVLRTPAEYGMEYEDVSFPALDGLTIKGWFIPADSDKLIIVNHFMTGNRYGYPGHLEPNDPVGYEVNYLPQHKALHDAGYNILAYDLRNHGESETYNNGYGGNGQNEYRDVIGSIRYAKSRKDTADMKIGLYSICYGCNSTLVAISKHSEEFSDIKALLALQPASAGSLIGRFFENNGIDKEAGMALADKTMSDMTGFHIQELSPIEATKSVTMPTLIVQVHDDSMSHPEDVQSIFDNMPAADKKLFWIEGTTDRFRGYTYFNDQPELLLEWFNIHMK
ncbi:alpha/beta hydrolase [Chryseobacterium piperi]|nr:alpha/beta hydrolase [Chryseobacterium piperi]